jgi:O-acetyl-ADP-ribose deacetylase (regulator of RNase III)
MILVTRGTALDAGAQAVLCPVSDALQPVSAWGRDVGRSAGPALQERLDRWGDLPSGAAAVTPPGDLPCDVLIHVSVQERGESASEQLVERAFLNALRRAAALGIESIATPPLGSGAQGLDAEASARAMRRGLMEHRARSHLPRTITVVVSGDYEEDVFRRVLVDADGMGPEAGSPAEASEASGEA